MKYINILGTQYEVIKQTEKENPKLKDANGLCEPYTRQIIYKENEQSIDVFDNIAAFDKKNLRHEIIHAFFAESGLTEYMEDEVLVEWIAVQFPKISRIIKEVENEENIKEMQIIVRTAE
jgi:hypothetical protein